MPLLLGLSLYSLYLVGIIYSRAWLSQQRASSIGQGRCLFYAPAPTPVHSVGAQFCGTDASDKSDRRLLWGSKLPSYLKGSQHLGEASMIPTSCIKGPFPLKYNFIFLWAGRSQPPSYSQMHKNHQVVKETFLKYRCPGTTHRVFNSASLG